MDGIVNECYDRDLLSVMGGSYVNNSTHFSGIAAIKMCLYDFIDGVRVFFDRGGMHFGLLQSLWKLGCLRTEIKKSKLLGVEFHNFYNFSTEILTMTCMSIQ